jgi:hypothetical protein
VPAVLFGLFAGCAQVRPTVENDPSLEFVELGDYRFHVQTFGDKQLPPVIVVHGGPGGDSKYLPFKACPGITTSSSTTNVERACRPGSIRNC